MSRVHCCLFVCLLAGLAAIPAGVLGQDDAVVDVPVTKAVLFSSGVGYFEHSGTVEGDATVRLHFKTSQINDILKSMVLLDLDGGTANSVSYAGNEPIDRALGSFSIDISGQPTLADLLRQMRGAQVVVEGITGKILSVETEERITGTPPAKLVEHILRLVTDGGIQSVRLSATTTLTFTDKKMQGELNEALALLIGARNTDRKPVDLRFNGKGKRRVRIGYLVESPVWKTSYRLDLSPDKPLLQGWAIVENTSDNDWKEINLSLVSGRPISFIQDLYTPLYLQRPTVMPELFASLRPRLYEEGIDQRNGMIALQTLDRTVREKREKQDGEESLRRTSAVEKLQLSDSDADKYFSIGQSVKGMATGASVGELFQYTIVHPVNMQRRRSAMLPIINQAVKAERVSIYNASQHATIPLNGIYLINDTGLKLLAGPVTVFDGGTYAGDAQIGHLSPGDKRLLSYAMDLAVTVDASIKSHSQITGATLVRGVLTVTRSQTFTQTYKIKNKAAQKRVMIIEHPFVNGRRLIAPATFEEKTPDYYRFRVPLDGAAAGEFVVQEEQPIAQQVSLVGAAPSAYLTYLKEGAVSDQVKAALQKAATLQGELADLDAQLKALTQQKNTIEAGQERLRKNIETAGRDSVLGKRYLDKLTQEEDQLEELATQIVAITDKVKAKQKELSDYLNGLELK